MAEYVRAQSKNRIYPLDVMSLQTNVCTATHDKFHLIMSHRGEMVILGSFDTVGQVNAEIRDICACSDRLYKIGGGHA